MHPLSRGHDKPEAWFIRLLNDTEDILAALRAAGLDDDAAGRIAVEHAGRRIPPARESRDVARHGGGWVDGRWIEPGD